MGKMSRNKGKVGEREAAKLFRSFGFEAQRGQQHSGSPDSPDIKTNLHTFHFEIKRTERFNLYVSLRQAISDAGDKTPIVLTRSNKTGKKDEHPKGEWIAVLKADDLLKLLQNIHSTE